MHRLCNLFLVLLACSTHGISGEIRVTPWVWPGTQQHIVDGYLWFQEPNEISVFICLPNQAPQAIPLFNSSTRNGVLSATVWRDGPNYQVIVRALTEKPIRTCTIEVRTARAATRYGFSAATASTLMQVRAFGGKRYEVHYGGLGPAEVIRAGPIRITAQTSNYLYPPQGKFWQISAVMRPTHTLVSNITDPERVLLDLTQSTEITFLRYWGMFPHMTWDYNWVINPTFLQSLRACVPKADNLAAFYQAVSLLGPVTVRTFWLSPDARALLSGSKSARRDLLAGVWYADALVASNERAVPRDMEQTIATSGRTTQTVPEVLSELRSQQLPALIPILIGRHDQVYSLSLFSLANKDALFWVDSNTASPISGNIDVTFQDRRFTEDATNLPWLGCITVAK